jgi:nudix-type nucleoside diphosphatase (YffH/AdpP family)
LTSAIIGRETIYAGWTKLSRVRVRMPDGGIVDRHIEDHGRAAAALPYDPVRKTLLFVSQPRAPVIDVEEKSLLELAAGRVEDGELPEDCVRREAMEELGIRLQELEHVVTAWSMPAISAEKLDLYLAAYAAGDRVAAGGGAAGEHEDISVVELPAAEVWRLAGAGALPDMKTLLAVFALHARRPDLFGI